MMNTIISHVLIGVMICGFIVIQASPLHQDLPVKLF